MKLEDLSPEEWPRERLIQRGAEALSDGELIAILLRTGTAERDALELAHELLTRYGSLAGLARTPARELAQIKGIGPAKAVQLSAAFGLGARLGIERFERVELKTPEQVMEMIGNSMRALRQETMRVLLLDARYRFLQMETVSVGTLNESLAHPREIFRPAVTASAYAIIVVHNHPSGDPAPSPADHRITARLKAAADVLQIYLHDHIIVGTPGFTSFRRLGVL